MEDLIIPKGTLKNMNFSAKELKIELAVYLYDKERLSIGKAKTLADLDLVTFQKELAKRGVCIKYDIGDLEKDLRALEDLGI